MATHDYAALNVKIRKVRVSDLPEVAKQYGKEGESPWDPFCSTERMKSIPKNGFLVARIQNEYVGFIYWFKATSPWFDKDASTYAHIQEVHVIERFRGHGIGKALISDALKRIKQEGINTVYIDTTEENSSARHLYESAGFRPFMKTLHFKLK